MYRPGCPQIQALSEEKQTYDRSSSKTVYLNVAVNTLKRLRREAAQDGGASSAGSGASGTGAAATVPAQPTNRVVSHEMVLQGARAARTSFSIEKNRYRKPPPELTGEHGSPQRFPWVWPTVRNHL
ncbi:hypothetical protein HPB50_005929 [Hyalomma asiaticum]|uniref:Uncharacterized protein n=1 Tax=Hyalomma asiaticum TaxID=266040 RepID=A0ACB7SZX7_HYAAI|nr:hypothetical protein HPB50_005929 [Hyalomma asiaticum]